ncbi:ABC transporter substrate-binding protein [Hydrogenophaga sp. 5NK40-0174]|uniref:ABC transporter substrate-binding protein n=1 Tax=Hydrogenophaga sp. 5NK40-0174 TaxID=3127649 RepID=UPI003106F207
MKLLMLYRRRWWLLYLPFLALLLLFVATALRWWEPIPPRSVTIGTGPAQSSYLRLARAYAQRLEAMGIEVRIVTHERPQDPLYAMKNEDSQIDVTFAQGLYATQASQVEALAVVGHEIVWVVAREGIYSADDLRQKTLAVSVEDSSNQRAALLLMQHLRIQPGEITLLPLVGNAAISAFSKGEIDAVIHVATGSSQTAATLVRLPNAHVLGIDRAAALSSRDARLRAVVMPQGSIELRANLPESDLPTLVTQTHLVARTGLHPALQRALINVASELHVMGGFLERQGDYPTTLGSDYPVSGVASEAFRGNKPWLESVLPYRTAQWTQLMLFLLVPLAFATAFIFTRAPRFFQGRVDAILQHFYGELKFLEEELIQAEDANTKDLRPLMQRLEALERQVTGMDFPDDYVDRWYTLREHMDHVRDRFKISHPNWATTSRR